MSFAATLALIAAYQYGLPWHAKSRHRVARARGAVGRRARSRAIAFASLVAGLATTPYAAYHFHRLAPYGVLANVLAMPVVSVWVMPMGILGVLTLPLGFDAVFWRLMGDGIDWIIAVVLWVAHLPGAVGRIHAFGTGPLLLFSAGLLLLCLLRTPLRLSGDAADVRRRAVGGDDAAAGSLGVRRRRDRGATRADGRLAVLQSAATTSRSRIGSPPTPTAATCTIAGLRRASPAMLPAASASSPMAALVAYALEPDAFEDDCARAALIVAVHDDPPPDCAAQVIGRRTWYDRGALALRFTGSGFVMGSTRPKNFDRPWAPAPRSTKRRHRRKRDGCNDATPRDATPLQDDIEADQ